MKDINLLMGRTLFISVLISAALITIGGVLFLWQHAFEVYTFTRFNAEPHQLTSLAGMLKDVFHLKPRGLIQLGLFLLFFTQIIRVAMVAWLFLQERNPLFFRLSLFIFLVLIVSLCWSLL